MAQEQSKHEGLIFKETNTGKLPVFNNELKPSAALLPYIQSFWEFAWGLPENEEISSFVIPSGCINIVFEDNPSHGAPGMVVGLRTKAFLRTISGKGKIVGVRFAPGAFFPFFGKPVGEITDTVTTLQNVFGHDGERLTRKILSMNDFSVICAAFEAFFSQRVPALIPDELNIVKECVSHFTSEDAKKSVRSLCESLSIGERRLERIFDKFVGISPKMLHRSIRFQAVAAGLRSGKNVDWAVFAQEMEYVDQAHFLKDFKDITGLTPSDIFKKP